VPHLRRGIIAPKVGIGEADQQPDSRTHAGHITPLSLGQATKLVILSEV
jgi:hypothetical protein